MENINLLIVEDRKAVAENVESRLKELEYTVCAVVPTGAQAVEKAAEMQPDIVLIDIELEGEISGIEAAEHIRTFLDIPTIYLADYRIEVFSKKEDLLKRAEITSPFEYIPLPFGKRKLYLSIESAVYQHRMEANKQQIVTDYQNLEVSHQRLKTVLDSAEDAVGMFDDKGRLLFANQYYQQLLDLTEDQLRQMSPDELAARMKTRFQEPALSRPEAGPVSENVKDVVEAVGEESQSESRLFYRSITPVCNNQGDSAGNVVSYRDMSKEVGIQQMKTEVLRLRTEPETIYSFDEIVGKSQKMQQMFALMQRAAASDITVLISGESGTGKELVARAIHADSDRKSGPFITVNCAAIPETLIESELFGHERGAFTGATAKRIGKFEQANRGTIFFDEIGDMQLVLQAKLLRVLQEQQIQRVGGTADIPVDVRVLTATNQDLDAAVEAGSFRTDLFYRIAVFPIAIPPLRDRREDIPLLADHFLKKYASSVKKSIKAISADALRLLMQYDFPGNVRELENMIRRAVLLETTDLLQLSNLSPQILSMISSQPLLSSPDSTGILPFEEVERHTLAHALEMMDNNVTKAAQALKIDRSTLYRKVKLYKLRVPN